MTVTSISNVLMTKIHEIRVRMILTCIWPGVYEGIWILSLQDAIGIHDVGVGLCWLFFWITGCLI